MTQNQFYQRDVISINDFTREDVETVLAVARQYKQQERPPVLQNRLIGSCFFEPSTRTRLSFEAAAYRAGANVIGFSSGDGLSLQKGETLQDTVRMISQYVDLIVIRHMREGAARLAAEIADVPVINAGDGANEHPTQALTDLFTVCESASRLDGLSVALVGDLKYGRAIHSFVEICSLYDIRLYLVAPATLLLPESLCDQLKKRRVRFSFHHAMEEVLPKVDVLYLTRLQRERYEGTAPVEVQTWMLQPAMLKKARPHLKILHPLPRVHELPREIDSTPHASYFEQARNGLFIRQALLDLILNESAL